MPLNKIVDLAKTKKIPVLIDGCQGAPHIKLDMQKLDCDFYDTDKLVEKAEGRKIKDIFEQNGEDYFRQKESKALSEIKTLQNAVIATV